MSKIHVLPEHIANKISAGEVIERPSSIVKELLENSLDANATDIEVIVKNGGKSLIRIADNGTGMNSEDAEIAFKRHATSKIETDKDLEHIQSFGFRGEALASIAAVSRVNLMTREKGSDIGTEIEIEGGALKKSGECSCAQGTIIEIRDLFFNTPGRRKFLKQDTTEWGHISDIVSYIALVNPQVNIQLIHNGKKVFDFKGTGDSRNRLQQVFGEDFSSQCLPIEGELPYVKVSGFIGKPVLAKGNRTGQYFFINGRYVKAFTLSYALDAGFHGFMMHGKYPSAIIFLELDPERVDVNVHPTKQQVRLSNEPSIKSFIQKTVASTLEEAEGMVPSLTEPLKQDPIERIKQASREFERTAPQDFSFDSISKHHEALFEEPSVSEPHSTYGGKDVVTEGSNELFEIHDGLHVTKVLGQVHGTFILAETDQGYIVVDQHAAHERIQYEALLEGLKNKKPVSQKLLMEEILEISSREIEIFQKNEGFLKDIGFDAELFGEKEIIIRAVPSIFKTENPSTTLKHFLEEKEAGKIKSNLEEKSSDVAALLACKRHSIRAHDTISLEEMKSLLKRLAACDNPYGCPHGRPAILKYSFQELEKQFKRKE